MPSQIPKKELDTAYKKIKALMGFLSSDSERYLEKDVIGYVMPDAMHSYMLGGLRTYSHVLGELGETPQEVADEIVSKVRRENVPFKLTRKWEDKIRHDIRGMVRNAQRVLSTRAKNFLYPGLTSYDLVNTAHGMARKDFAYELMIPKSIEFSRSLIGRGREHKDTVLTGRTHKQHAAATTVAHYFSEILGGFIPGISGYRNSADELRGKLSGFVGTNATKVLLFDTDPEEIDRRFFELIGLKRDETTGQVVHQYWYNKYFSEFVNTLGSIAKFANDVRNYQQTEVGEMFEQMLDEQVGSSTGAHKKNPITTEQLCGMRWTQLVAQLFASYADFMTDFQRDLRDSANKRIYIENMTNLGYGMIKKATNVAKKMTIRKEKMAENLGITQGLICAEPLQTYLQRWLGLNTDRFFDAHEYVRKLSDKARKEGKSFIDLAKKRKIIQRALQDAPEEKKEMILNPEKYLGTCLKGFERDSQKWEKELYSLEKDVEKHIEMASNRI
ncbi:MAG: hypothetical protein JSW41_01515 [Candidatus Aenigmatarchaeota archaeon]|nr:MAG: hypothetical protein JSW41_01515 [Candidatus Aenigmarchaeota archaeon]